MLVRMSLGFLPVAGLISTPGTGQNFGRVTLATTCAFPLAENMTAGVVAARVPLQNTDKARSGTGFLFPGGMTSPLMVAVSRPSVWSATTPWVIFHGAPPAVTPKIFGSDGTLGASRAVIMIGLGVLASGAAEAAPPSTAQPPRAMAVAPAPAMIIRSRVRITITSRIRIPDECTPFASAWGSLRPGRAPAGRPGRQPFRPPQAADPAPPAEAAARAGARPAAARPARGRAGEEKEPGHLTQRSVRPAHGVTPPGPR